MLARSTYRKLIVALAMAGMLNPLPFVQAESPASHPTTSRVPDVRLDAATAISRRGGRWSGSRPGASGSDARASRLARNATESPDGDDRSRKVGFSSMICRRAPIVWKHRRASTCAVSGPMRPHLRRRLPLYWSSMTCGSSVGSVRSVRYFTPIRC